MVEITTEYQGQLHCVAKHGPSGTELTTDYNAICDAVRESGLGFEDSGPRLKLAG